MPMAWHGPYNSHHHTPSNGHGGHGPTHQRPRRCQLCPCWPQWWGCHSTPAIPAHPKYGQKIGILTPKRWKIQQMGRWKRRKLFSDCLYLFANVAHRVDSHEPWVVQHWVFSMHILSLEWSTCECLQDSWVANAGCVPIGYQDAWFPHAVSDK